MHCSHLARVLPARPQRAVKPQVSCVADLCQLPLLWKISRNPIWVSEQNSHSNVKSFPVTCSKSIADGKKKILLLILPLPWKVGKAKFSTYPSLTSLLQTLILVSYKRLKWRKVKLKACPDTSHLSRPWKPKSLWSSAKAVHPQTQQQHGVQRACFCLFHFHPGARVLAMTSLLPLLELVLLSPEPYMCLQLICEIVTIASTFLLGN